MLVDPWQLQLQLHLYHFFDSRPQFVSTDGRFEEWVMVAPEAGRFTYEIDTESGEANFGEVLCVPPHSVFQRHVSTPTLTYHVFQWYRLSQPDDLLDTFWSAGKWLVGDTSRLSYNFSILRRLQYRLDSFSVRRRALIAQDVLHLLWETRHVLPQVTDPLMEEAATLIRERAMQVISMQDISSHLGLGPVQFTSRFHEAHGMNPIEYLTQQRLEAAQRILIKTDKTIDEIALLCGWSHGSYLSRVFTQHFGITPGAFRKQRRV